jgi:uncharacterized protein YgiM (DUF1202 family)
MQRIIFIMMGLSVISLGAASLTEATLAYGGRNSAHDGHSQYLVHPVSSATPQPTTALPSPPAVAVTPASTPVPASTRPSATTNAFVHLRASASTNSAIIANLDGGSIVTLEAYSDQSWQEVSVNGQTGYIYKSYLIY